MHRVTRRGFTLIETMLAVTVGLMLIAGSIATYNQINRSSKFARSKTIVGTVQTNIQMDKFRLGSPPPLLSTTNDTTGQLWGVGRNRDIRQSPDGFNNHATENRDGKPTPVVRLEPVDRGTTR